MSKFDPHRYTISIKLVTLDEGEHFEAVVAELPDLVEYGETYDEAYSLAVESIQALQADAEEQGRTFPPPMPSHAVSEHSGRVTLRMAKTLHASATKLAALDGISLNSWIVEAIAFRVGRGLGEPGVLGRSVERGVFNIYIDSKLWSAKTAALSATKVKQPTVGSVHWENTVDSNHTSRLSLSTRVQ
jgi:predicted RNase H-like HicB family nuclease